MVVRTRALPVQIRLTEDERGMLDELARAEGEALAVLVRRWIRQHYEEKFGAPRRAPAKKSR